MLISNLHDGIQLVESSALNGNIGPIQLRTPEAPSDRVASNEASKVAAIGTIARNEASTSIAVVDPRSLLRECVVRFVASSHNFSSTGYSSIEDVMACKESKNIALVLLYSSPQSRHTTLDEVARLKDDCPTRLIVVLVDTSDYGFVRELLQQGARGVIPTAFPANVVLEALSLVLAGGTFVPVESFLAVQQTNALRPAASGVGLTNREEQIVSHLRSGKSNKQIAFELDLSLGTVKVHLHNIMKKLGAHNRIQVLATQYPIAVAGRPMNHSVQLKAI
jgi:DNA-binding NarL/FixJ family response regulator